VPVALASIGGAQSQSVGIIDPPGIVAPGTKLLLAQQTTTQNSSAQKAGAKNANANNATSQTGTTAAQNQDPVSDLFNGVKKATTDVINSVDKTSVNGIVNAVTKATNDALNKAGLSAGNPASQDQGKTTEQSTAGTKAGPAKAAPANAATSLAVRVDPGGGYRTPSAGNAITARVDVLVNIELTVTNGKVSKPIEFPSVDGIRLSGSGNNSNSGSLIFYFFLTPTRTGDFTIRPFDIRTDEGQSLHVDAIKFHVIPL
jgi:oxygen tolerance protein BatD